MKPQLALLVPLAVCCHRMSPAPLPPFDLLRTAALSPSKVLPLAATESRPAVNGPSLSLVAATATDESTTAPGTTESELCPGLGASGYFARAVSPASDGLGAGLGVGVCVHGSMLLVMRSEYAVWAVGDAETGDWGAMGELSFGLGGPRWPAHALAGVGLALPLWDVGDLDLNSTWLCYAGAWLVVDRGGGRDFSLSARHTWYSEQPTLSGQPVEMDGWSMAFSWYF